MSPTRATVLSAVLIGGLLATATPAFATEGDLVYEADLDGAHVKVVETTDGEMWDVTVTNVTEAPIDFGLGVTTHEPSTIEYLWQSPWTYFADETHELVEAGQSYTHYLPAWPGVTMAFYRDVDIDPVEIGEFTSPGNFVPFIVTGSEETELTIQWGATLQVTTPQPRAGETVHVSADWVYAANVDLYLLTEQEAIDNFGQGLASWSSVWGVPDGAVPFATLTGSGTRVEGDVTLPTGLEPGDYAIIATDALSGESVAGPPEVAFMAGDAGAHNLTVSPGAPRGTTDTNGVPVTPLDQYGNQPVSLIFDNITTPGITSVTSSSTGPTPNVFAQLGGANAVFYDLTTTASFTGDVRVCLTFDPSIVPEEELSQISLYHYDGTEWQDITQDFPSQGVVCGVTQSLSPFALGIALTEFSLSSIPTISGTKAAGSTLTVNRHAWDPVLVNGDFSYQWNRDGLPISGANATIYALTPADAGTRITVSVTAAKPRYVTRTETSAQTGYITGGVWTQVGTPTVSGTPAVGQYLYADPGISVPSPTTVKYQWFRAADGTTTNPSSSNRYTVRSSDAGSSVYVIVTTSKPGFPTNGRSSGLTPTLIEGQLTTATPTISGSPLAVGSTLHANAGTWGPGTVDFGYQWLRNGVPIAGATSVDRILTADDAGQLIAVRVTGSKVGFTSVTKTSGAKTILKQLSPPPTPVIYGTPAVGQVLTADAGVWGPGTVTLKYQWYRNGSPIGGLRPVSTYTVVAADAGTDLTVRVTGSEATYSAAVSALSSPYAIEGQLVTSTPTITGSPLAVGTILAANASWGPVAVDYGYQWKRNGVAIEGAVASTYPLVADDAGQSITVTVTGSATNYTSVTRTSGAKTIQSVFATVPKPTILGTSAVNQVLTADVGAWVPTATTYTYSWKRDGVTVVGTASTYTVKGADRGHTLTVTVSGTKTGYTKATSIASDGRSIP